MKKSIFTILFLGAQLLVVQAQVSPYLSGRFQYVLDSVCSKYKIKGTSAAILIPNVGVWKGVNGVSEEGVPLTSNMLFGMGSNTKTHIAATLLKMQEQQLLSLNDTIGKWIIGYPNISGRITIRQCLNHTSGLFDYMQNGSINDSIFGTPSKVWLRSDILRLAQAPNFAPGSSYSYSNTNYIIAGIIIEKVMNKSPFQAIHDLILEPNQLTNTFNYGDQGSSIIAHPWSMSMDGLTLTDMTTTPFLNNLFSLANTAGSLLTTAEDNVQFWHKLFNGQIVNTQSWKEMTTMINIGNNTNYGLGIFRYNRKINGRTAYSHGGTFFGFINENIVDTTSGISIAVLTNQDSVNNNGLLNLVIGALHKVTLNMPATFVNEISQNESVKIFPNPACNELNIEMSNNFKINAISIFDNTGKMVLNIIGNHDKIILNQLPEGLYFITVEGENKTINKKFLIRR
ncbi:MAG: serine hydrolase [Bacteroidia bacterium]